MRAINRKAELAIVEYIKKPIGYLDSGFLLILLTNPYMAGAGRKPSNINARLATELATTL